MELFNNTNKYTEAIVVGIESKNIRMPIEEAIRIANERSLDLVQVNISEGIPVLKICDYSKLAYDKQKREKEQQKKQRKNRQAIKEIRISYGTSKHDLETKARAIDKFLNSGDKVVLSIQFKGRTIKFVQSGIEKLNSLASLITSDYIINQAPRVDNNKVTMIISAKLK